MDHFLEPVSDEGLGKPLNMCQINSNVFKVCQKKQGTRFITG